MLINLHGGGFVLFRGLGMGMLESIPVASMGRIKVITIDYRQAPSFTYPAASEDVAAVYRELLKQYKPEGIGMFGCSAGGVLTAQMVAWFQAAGLPRPGAIGIFCAAPPTASHLWQGGDSMVWAELGVPASSGNGAPSLPSEWNWYMEGADINDVKAYPGASDRVLAKFPPTLLLSGTRAFEMSHVVVAHARLLRLGVESSLYIMEGAWHGAVLTADTPEGRAANAYIAHWFDRHLVR